jgi:aspartate racemase
MKTLGLIGGISWISTVEYYRLINEQVNARLGGNQFASCIIRSFNYGEIQALTFADDWDGLLDKFSAACIHLRDAGAEGIVLCANTAHRVADKLEQRVELPVIHIGEATASAVEKAGVHKVGLLGTRFTMEGDFIKRRLEQRHIEVIIPDIADRDFIHSTIFGELGRGEFRPETKRRYVDIISELASRGAQGAILGCTEIPMLITQNDISVTAFDTTFLHATAAVDFALS